MSRISHFYSLCQGFSKEKREGLTLEERSCLERSFPEFLKVCSYLEQTLNDDSRVFLKKACSIASNRWSLILKDCFKLQAHMNDCKVLYDEVIKHAEEVRLIKSSGKRKVQGDEKVELEELVAKITRQISGSIVLPVKTKIDVVTLAEVKNSTEQSLVEVSSSVIPEIDNVLEGSTGDSSYSVSPPNTDDETKVSQDVSPNGSELPHNHAERQIEFRRRKEFLKALKKEIRQRKAREQAAKNLEFEQLKKQEEGFVREVVYIPQIPKKRALSIGVKMYLEQLNFIVSRLKLKAGESWSVKMIYALLGAMAHLNETLHRERKIPTIDNVFKDQEVCNVAKHLRNALYKSHNQIKVSFIELLEIAEAWSTFLQKPEIGFFANEDAVLAMNPSKLRDLYDLGKNLSAKQKNDISIEDVHEARETIKMGVSYLNKRTQEVPDPAEEQVNAAADSFCRGIIGSAVQFLQKAIKKHVPNAKENLEKALGEELFPLREYLIEEGIIERHKIGVIYETSKTTVPVIVLPISMSEPRRVEDVKQHQESLSATLSDAKPIVTFCNPFQMKLNLEQSKKTDEQSMQKSAAVRTKFTLDPMASTFTPKQ